MPTSCCAIGCTNRFVKHTGIKFYRIPKTDFQRRIKWIIAISRRNWVPNNNSRLCSEHFISGKPSDDPADPDYIPSLFNFHPLKRSRKKQKFNFYHLTRKVMANKTKDAATVDRKDAESAASALLNLSSHSRKDAKEETIESEADESEKRLELLPLRKQLKDGSIVSLEMYHQETDEAELFRLFREVLEEGDKYPFELSSDKEELKTFRRYYTSDVVFIVRFTDTRDIVGAFYIKPNFPGLSSHVCNAGFLVDKEHRSKGIGKFMVVNYLHLAKELGYKASCFNLVYVTNVAAVQLYRNLGFVEIGRLPKAGNLKNHGYTDAIQFYYDLESLNLQL